MTISNSLKLQEPNSFDIKEIEFGAPSGVMAGKESGGRFAPTAIRMRAIRRASAYAERLAFAEFLGITRSSLANFENGFPISTGLQNRIAKKLPWVSMDWLLNGREDGLSGAKLQDLRAFVAEESVTTTPRSRSKGTSCR